jgi:hypothetical protein
VQRIVHLLFTYLPPNLTAESAQLRVSRERPIAQAHPEAEILLRIRRMLHDDTRSIWFFFRVCLLSTLAASSAQQAADYLIQQSERTAEVAA